MDALPVTEQSGAEFASEVTGCMHACGHDVHTSALLGAARLFSLHRDEMAGTVIFIFQPDEEGNGGAERMIASGLLDEAEAIYGCHVDPTLPLGTVGIKHGLFYANATTFNATIHGRSAHGATPQLGVDALAVATEITMRLRHLVSQSNDNVQPKTNDDFPDKSDVNFQRNRNGAFSHESDFDFPPETVISIGTLNAGTAINIIPDTATFTGIARTFGLDARDRLCDRIDAIINEVCEEFGATAEIDIRKGYPGIMNSDECSELAERAISSVPEINVQILEKPLTTTEDFGYYINYRKGAFYHIGAGCSHPLHSNNFLPDDMAVMYAIVSFFVTGFFSLNY